MIRLDAGLDSGAQAQAGIGMGGPLPRLKRGAWAGGVPAPTA